MKIWHAVFSKTIFAHFYTLLNFTAEKKKIIHLRKRIIVHEFGETNVYRLDERARSVPRNRITDVSVTAGARGRTPTRA